jgi:hypothetical protein
MFHVDFTCHVVIPSVLRKGDTEQGSLWDRSRVAFSRYLSRTSPRWQHVADAYAQYSSAR